MENENIVAEQVPKKGRGRPRTRPIKPPPQPRPKFTPEQLAINRKRQEKESNDKLKAKGYFKKYNQEKVNGVTVICPECGRTHNKLNTKRHERSNVHIQYAKLRIIKEIDSLKKEVTELTLKHDCIKELVDLMKQINEALKIEDIKNDDL